MLVVPVEVLVVPVEVLAGVELVVVAPLPPHPATATVLARTATSVRMAVSGVLLMGVAPIVAGGRGSSPYQSSERPIAVGRRVVSAEATATPGAGGAPSAEDSRRSGSGSALLLAVCCVAQFMVILDLSIVNVALPSIQSSLGFSSPDLQWVVDAYAITFAGFLMMGGRAADHFGQRRMLVVALILFGLASLAGGAAPDQLVLVAARAIQGLAGALMAATSLAIITASFPPGPQLHRAIGAWAAMNGLGGAAGVLLGGIITEVLSWRWVLLINPPIAVAAALVAYGVVTERRRARAGDSFDLAGALTLTIGQMVLVYGVVEAGLKGWGTLAALGPILGGLALLGVFGVIEARLASAPLIPFKELTRPLRAANTIVLLFSAALFPMWFVGSLYLQQVLGLSPLHTGLIFLPMTLTIMLIATRAGKLVSRFGVRPVLGGGLVMLTGGLLLFTRIGSSGSPIIYVVIPGVLTAAGIAHVDRALHDRRHPGRQGGPGGARLRPREHLPPGRGRPRACAPDHLRHPAHHPPDRLGRAGGAGADRRLPAGLPDRRRSGGGGGAGDVHAPFPGPTPRVRARRRRFALAVGGVARRLPRPRRRLRGLPRRPARRLHHHAAPTASSPRRRSTRRCCSTKQRPGGRARSGLHLHRELLRPQRTADRRSERAADPRPQPAAGVVPAGARKGRGLEPEPAVLRRQARACLVAGRGHEHRRHRIGEDVVVNQHYQPVARLKGWTAGC